MAFDRPTFSESWYRVAELRPRLRSTVQTFRQHYRGRTWHVVRDPANNQFFRLDDAAYHFIALLDGRRTVDQVWNTCQEHLGDAAPTQGEAIHTLGQLYASNLLQTELPGDTLTLFDRYKQRRQREITGYLANLLFARVPILDPDRWLDRWVVALGWVFSIPGLVLWLLLIATGVWFISPRFGELYSQAQNVLNPNPESLALLYLSFAGIKAIHEMGHALACKRFGTKSHSGGEVHTIGIMFLVFTPVPYVDASSAWALRSKWQRAVVGAAGMYVELAVAAVAAMIWANTGSGTVVHAITYNVMFVASVSTILFNANPLLRYDGYYILSDILEIPNLGQRANEYLYYLARRYAFGVKSARTTARSATERLWLFVYAITSGIYRVVISVNIVLFIADKLFFLGVFMAVGAIVGWVLKPIWSFVRYLATSPELQRSRSRAYAVTAVALTGVFALVGMIPFPDRSRAEGIVEPRNIVVAHTSEEGFVKSVIETGAPVRKADDAESRPIIEAVNETLQSERNEMLAERKIADAKYRAALVKKLSDAQILQQQIGAIDQRIARIDARIENLRLKPPITGTWVAPAGERLVGGYAKQGDRVGLVADLSDLIVRVVADQNLGPRITPELFVNKPGVVEARLNGKPDAHFTGTTESILPAGTTQLPSAALGYAVGGSLAVDPTDTKGSRTTEAFFEIIIKPDASEAAKQLLVGQRVVVRFEMPPKPLLQQWWLTVRQLVQRRFQV